MRPAQLYMCLASICMAAMCTFPALSSDKEEFDVPPERGVTMDGPTTKRMGVATATVQQTQFRSEAHGLGVVISVDTLAQTEAELRTAESAERASRAAFERAQNLYKADTAVSRQVMETAENQAAADAAALSLAQRKAATVWGRSSPLQDTKQRAAILSKLANGESVLVRVTFSATGPGNGVPNPLKLERLDSAKGAKTWTTSKVWTAPADPTVPGRSFFALIDNAEDLAEGEHLRVVGPVGEAKQGVIIPAAAVLLADGQTWCYIAEKADYFARQLVDLSQPTDAGYFVANGVMPGESVVITGAAHLLALETGASEAE